MMPPRRSKLLVIILILLPILLSCAELKSRPAPVDPAETPPPVKKTSKKSIQTSAQVVDLAKAHMEAGDYQKAVAIYNFAYRRYPTDRGLLAAYVKSIENIKSAADRAFVKADFASAGRNYDFLLKNYTHFTGFEKKLSFQSPQLNEKLYNCRFFCCILAVLNNFLISGFSGSISKRCCHSLIAPLRFSLRYS